MQRLQESGVDEDVSAGFEDSENFAYVRQKRSERMSVKIFPSRCTIL